MASYGQSTRSTGQVRLTKDLDTSIEGLHTILVEDILDTGLTLDYLQRVLSQRKPRSLRLATFLVKAAPRVKQIRPDYVGFEIPNEFVVGYGLDYAERYRNLRDICVLAIARGAAIPDRQPRLHCRAEARRRIGSRKGDFSREAAFGATNSYTVVAGEITPCPTSKPELLKNCRKASSPRSPRSARRSTLR